MVIFCVPIACDHDSDFRQLGWDGLKPPVLLSGFPVNICEDSKRLADTACCRFAKGLEWIHSLEWSSETVCNRSFLLSYAQFLEFWTIVPICPPL